MKESSDSFTCVHFFKNIQPMTAELIGSFQNNTPALLVTILCCSILAMIGKFHWNRRKLYKAVAKIKGPPTLPIIGNALLFMGDTTNYSDQLSRIWLGTKLLFIVTKPEHFEIIMNSPHCLGKDTLYEYTRAIAGTGLFAAPVPQWKKNRKLISPAFNQKILDSFMGIFNDQSRILLTNLETKAGNKDVEIYHLVSAMTIDSLCESAMGIKIESQVHSSELNKWMDTAMMIIFLRMANQLYSFDFIFNMTRYSKMLKHSITNFHQFTQKVVKEKRKHFEKKMEKLKKGEEIEEDDLHDKKTFLNLLLQLTHKSSKMTDEELRQEVDTFTIAGSDTTASILSFCFTMLGMHPDIQEKVRAEVIDILGEDRDVLPEDMSHLNLLERFIKETLRIFPVGPIFLRIADKDVNLGEHQIPAGCSIILGVVGVHRNPKIWKDPLKFDPDRFLPEEVAKRHPYSYLPFSGGPRNCIGYKYAMMSMKTTLALVLRKFIVKTEYKTIEEIRLKVNIVLKPSDGYKVSVLRRE